MARTYQVNGMVRFVNQLTMHLMRWNIARPHAYLLTVRGRKTGKAYSAPVYLIEHDGKRWLVAPYGEVNWVKNARAAGEVQLYRSGKTETLGIRQVDAKASAPILKEYLHLQGIVQPYFDTRADSPVEAFEAEASHHPVFLLEPK